MISRTDNCNSGFILAKKTISDFLAKSVNFGLKFSKTFNSVIIVSLLFISSLSYLPSQKNVNPFSLSKLEVSTKLFFKISISSSKKSSPYTPTGITLVNFEAAKLK